MTFGQLMAILRARRRAALIVFLVIVGLTVLLSLVLPKQYTGVSSIVIDVKPDPVSIMAFPTMATPGFMATQVDILTSERVTLRVIRDLRLTDNAEIRAQWADQNDGEGTIEQWLVKLLQEKLDVKPSRESNVVLIAYKAPDPRFAAGVANAFAQAYIATTLELRVDPAKQFTSFFNAQTKDSRDALERAQARVSAFQREKGILVSDERLDVENARLAELSSQLVLMEGLSSESTSRQAQAQGGQGDRLQEVLNNPLIAGLTADVARNQARLKELSSKLGDSNPQVIDAKANLAELRARVEFETRRVTGSVGVSNTINKQREAQLRKELDEQRAKVLKLKAVRDEGQVLVRDVENAQRIFESLSARFNQTSLEAQTTQSYANVLTMAQPPNEHSSPKLLLNTALSIFVGTLLAIGAALLMEMRDRRVRAAGDIVAALNLPVLGTLPKPNAKRFKSGRSALLLQQQSALGLPGPALTKGA